MPARRFDYPKGMEDEEKKKIFKHKTLMKNPEILYEDTYQTGIRCNLIFFTRSGADYRAAIEDAYPQSKDIQMANKLKLELSDGGTVSIFPSGKILIQGTEENLDAFEKMFNKIQQDVDARKEEQMMKTLQQMKVEESDSETEGRDKQKQSK